MVVDKFAARPMSRSPEARLITLLVAARRAGLTPISVARLHTFAYLANVLAPVWDMLPLDGTVLKRRGGPFYPHLQADLDRLVGLGMVSVSDIDHVRSAEGWWQIQATYALNMDLAGPAVDFLASLPDEEHLRAYIQELAYALSALSDADLDIAATEDAAYSDPLVAVGNVLDFGDWNQENSSFNAARYFDSVVSNASPTTAAEKLHLYVQAIKRRLSA